MKFRSPLLVKFLVWSLVMIIRAIMLTCRKVYVVPSDKLRLDYTVAVDDPLRFVGVMWHDQMLIPTFASHTANRRRTSCLISPHHDGGYLAAAMQIMGLKPVRGSSSRGGAQAIRQLMRDVDGMHIVITPDGPRGPRHVMKSGPVYISSLTGKPITACAYAARSEWRIKGKWTDQLIPKPFTTIYLVHSEFLHIPRKLTQEQIDFYAERVQQMMDVVNIEAERLAGRTYTPPQREQALSAAA